MHISKEIIQTLIKSKVKDQKSLAAFKRSIAKKYGISSPSNFDLLKAYHNYYPNKRNLIIENALKTRPVRSLSGIVNVSALTKPYACPGNCIYCPTEAGMPKSYLSKEPAAQRAKMLKFDPFVQIKTRLESLHKEGHPTDKIELRIIGGTWSYYPSIYRKTFIKNCFDACNGNISKTLELAQKKNQIAKHRIVGLSIETRPDYINAKEIKFLRELGITKIELGIQSIYDDVLEFSRRKSTRQDIINATKLLKDAGFKVSYQMMPNLPCSNPQRDLEMFKEIFSNQDFCPDYLKIYPLVLLKEAELYKIKEKIKFKEYTTQELIELIIEIKKIVPPYVRIERIIRDIPAQYAQNLAGQTTNMRQLVSNLMEKEGLKCKCIRCREIRGSKQDSSPKLFKYEYTASNGQEILLTFENADQEKLYSMLRLRIADNKKHYIKALQDCALIRDVHTFGLQTQVDKKHKLAVQHKGLGKKLIKEAERIAKKTGKKGIAIISSVGTREYYRKLGYKLKDTYMVKKING
ncbi:MAG TPA: tRNA uridine(34) 5-carboxymethylaminomethyl modification radical SAM/GNAT enzyme Elp3 [Candidatus Pacearchaeota archaeon]|nr:tRNA uridine(34) 5-carboxymethylaminomethyl modification radical SAM/GNAT enzyme Elp3 [Candidatus Pacearchaeota archaeon]HQI74795.1 tRNA uridine(34) 5-carboxymethylaminomethyl modification radical SAM/GNAT enzyme Elp3 [Candidatus Pacearchaeota archaeon]